MANASLRNAWEQESWQLSIVCLWVGLVSGWGLYMGVAYGWVGLTYGLGLYVGSLYGPAPAPLN